MISLEFLVTSLVVVLVPGAGVPSTVSTGLLQGRRASVYASFGCTLGTLPHLAATVQGLGHAFRALVIEPPRVHAWLRRGFAAAFAALGARLAASESST